MSLGVQEEHHLRAAKEIRHHTVERLWKITEELNILYKDNWTALANREIVKFQKELLAAELLQLNNENVKSKHGGGSSSKGSATGGEEVGEDIEGGGGWSTGTTPRRRVVVVNPAGSEADTWSFSDSFLYSLSLITTVGKLRNKWGGEKNRTDRQNRKERREKKTWPFLHS